MPRYEADEVEKQIIQNTSSVSQVRQLPLKGKPFMSKRRLYRIYLIAQPLYTRLGCFLFVNFAEIFRCIV